MNVSAFCQSPGKMQRYFPKTCPPYLCATIENRTDLWINFIIPVSMEFTFEKATINDIAALTQLVEEVWNTIEHKEWFALYDISDYIREFVDTEKGCIWKAIDTATRRIAGIYIVTYPGTDADNLGYDIGLSESQLLQVVHMDTVAVHPFYRGHGLQQTFTLLMERELLSGGFRYFMCTVHPDNIYSKSNMEKCGYKVMKTSLKYGGLPRLILLKNIPQKH